MKLAELNKMWSSYKKENHVDSDIMLSEVRFDAASGVEASFDLLEMLQGKYILHLTSRIHLYRGDFVKFLLTHEFTHLADFISYPYEKPTMADLYERQMREENVNTASDREIFGNYGEIRISQKVERSSILKEDKGKMLFDYMNTYSEFHACQVALRHILGRPGRDGQADKPREIDVDKNQIPGPFRDISIRRMLGDCLRRADIAYRKFGAMLVPQVFVLYFRQVMYLFGYVSYFGNDIETLRQSFAVLGVSDREELYLSVYQALKVKDVDTILKETNRIYLESYLPFVKEFIRRHYDKSLYTEEELDQITPDTYHEFMETITNRKGGRLWSGRVSPVYGVNNVRKAYGGVDVDTIREIIGKNKNLPTY